MGLILQVSDLIVCVDFLVELYCMVDCCNHNCDKVCIMECRNKMVCHFCLLIMILFPNRFFQQSLE